jgi:SAM-dependent methyltransferase
MDEELRARVMQGAQGAALLHVAYVGVTNALFEALSRRGPMSPSELAEEAGRSPGYVARWCDAAYAFELIDEVGEGRFETSPLGEAFRPSVDGSLMPMAVQTVLGAHMAERAAGLMVTGERPGEKVLEERETVLPWFGPMLEATFGPLFEQMVLPAVPVFEEVNARGGLAVDLGCGNGWYLRKLAARESRLRGIGLDAFEPNILNARRRAEDEGLSARLAFRVGDLHDFAVDEPADLIAMNRALHHVWNEKENVFRILREHLKPGGFAVIWEPAWPDSRAALRDPKMRGMAFQNLAEHVQGNHFLRPEAIAAELDGSGFDPEIHRVADGREAVVVGRKR